MPVVPGRKPADLMAGLLREGETPEAGPLAVMEPGMSGLIPEPSRPAPVPDLLSGLERQGDALEASLRVSGEQSPDQIARVLRASRASGLPPEAIAGNPKLEALADAPPFADWSRLAQRAPVVSDRLSRDPAAAGVARDDLLGLAAIEEEFKRFRRTPKLAAEKPSGFFQSALDWATGYDPARALAFGPVELEARRQGKTTEQLVQDAFGRPDAYLQTSRRQQDVGRGIVGTLGAMAGGIEWITGNAAFRDLSAQMRAAAVQGTPLDPDGATFAAQLASGLGSMVAFWLPGLGVGVGAGALAKVAPLTARWLGVGVMSAAEALSEAGSVYQDAKTRGMDDSTANRAAGWTFVLNVPMLAVTNKLGVFGGQGGLARRAAMGGAMEGAQEVLQSLISGGATGEGVTAKQLMVDFAIGGILGGPAAVATGKAMGAAKTAGPISEEGLLLESIERKLAASPAAKRDARTVNSIIADVAREYGAPEQVYVPVEAMSTLFQSRPEIVPTQTLSDLGVAQAAYLEAVDLGTPLAIPMDHLASAVMSPAWQAIRGQISFDPMAFVMPAETPQEAPAAEPGLEAPAAEKAPQKPLQAAQAAPERPAAPEAAPMVPVEAVRALEQTIASAGVPAAQAKANAALIVRAAENFARRAGIDPMAYLERRGFAFRREAAPEVPDAETLAQSAFHGSPYRFDKFSLEHIGKGEGAQAYGHGLYFAGKKEVAEFYRQKLTPYDVNLFVDGEKLNLGWSLPKAAENKTPERIALEHLSGSNAAALMANNKESSSESIDNAIKDLNATYKEMLSNPSFYPPQRANAYKNASEWLAKNKNRIELKRDYGQLYEVNIPEDNQLLDWDKPLSEQPDEVKKALANENISVDTTGEEIYRSLSEQLAGVRKDQGWTSIVNTINDRVNNDRAASEYLNSLGIPGLRYLDATSRGKGEGSYNYVIWDEDAINILKTLYQGERGAVSFLKDGQAIIRLFQGADPSTIPHEISHIFRRDLQELAEMEGADEQLRADWQAAQEWVGAQPGQEWTTAQEEQWATGFESYLREGRAPAPALRSLFNRFRAWLSSVYRAARDVGVQISPEMREVYDRLLASDEEIAAARAQEVVRPLFAVKPEWMNEAVWSSYQRLAAEAQASVAEKVLKRRLSDWRKAKRGWEAEALAEYLEDPAFASMRWLRERGGLNSADLAEEMNQAAISELERRGVASPQGAASLAELTQQLQAGVEDASLLAWSPEDWTALGEIDAAQYLAMTPTESEHVASQVAQKQAEFDAGLETWEAALTDEVLALMKAEAEALTGGLTVRPREATVKRRIKESVESETLGKLDSRLVTEKEALKFAMNQAARAARQAFSAGQRQGAGDMKWREWDIAARLKARQDAWAEVRAIRADFKKLLRTDPRKPSGMAWDFDIQVRYLLANYGIGRSPSKLPRREKSLAAFVAELQAAGEGISPPRWILDEQTLPPIRVGGGIARDMLAQLSLAHLRQLHETAMSLAYIGKGQNEMLAHMAGTKFQDARSRLILSIDEKGRRRFIAPGERLPEFGQSAIGKVGDRAHDAVANNTKVEFIVQQLDGGEKMGTAWEFLFRGSVLSENDQLRLEKELGSEMTRLKEALPKDFANNLHKRQTFPFLDQENKTVSNEQILAMALNMGNQGNLDALMTGWLGVNRAELARRLKDGEIGQAEYDAKVADGDNKLNQIVGILPREAWTFVQGVWDMLEERLAPRLDAVHRVMTGVPMSRVEPRSFTAPTGQEMRGGYYPLKWDPDASTLAEEFLIDQARQNLFEHPYKTNRPEQGFLIERKGGKLAPLLRLSVLQKHLDDTIRYVTHAPMLRDVNKLVSDPSVATAIARVAGQAKYKQFKPWLQGIARPDLVATNGLERVLPKFMRNYSVAMLAYNLKTVAMQPLALFNGAAEIGMPAAANGLLRYLASPERLGGWITEVSPYMANRQLAMDRDLRQAIRSGGLVGSSWHTFTREWGFYLIVMADSITARGIWLGAYDQAIRRKLSRETAIERADQVVRQTQGSGLPKDLPAVQRGSALYRAFTMFYTPFSATFNQIQAAHLSREPIQIIRAWSWAIVVPAILSSIADWGWDELKGKRRNNLSAWRIASSIPDYALGLLPFARLARGLAPEAINIAAGERVVEPGFEARGLPVITDPINRATMALRQLDKGDFDKAALSAMQILGPLAGLPANAIASYVKIIQHAGE